MQQAYQLKTGGISAENFGGELVAAYFANVSSWRKVAVCRCWVKILKGLQAVICSNAMWVRRLLARWMSAVWTLLLFKLVGLLFKLAGRRSASTRN